MKQVAEGVSKDMDEFNESFQQFLITVDGESSDNEDKQVPVEGASPPSSSSFTAQRQEILSRLEGEDTELEAGLKVSSKVGTSLSASLML